MSAAAEALSCRGVTAAYGRIQVCHGVDLEVGRGETAVLLGPNGAGKSSLLGALAGQVSSGGEVLVDGVAVERLSPHARAGAGLALVPEARGNCFPALSVRENLLLGARLAPPEERAEATEYVLGLFPILRKRLGQEASTLSGGEQQMLAIAMALARRPAVLALDEPSQGLAPRILLELADVFATLCEHGVGLLVAEQDHEFAARIAARFSVMVGGEIVARGGAGELDRDTLAEVYLSAGSVGG